MQNTTKLTIQISQDQAELFNAYADRLGMNQAKSLLLIGGFKEIKKHDDLLKREIKNLALASELGQSRLNTMIYQGFEPLSSSQNIHCEHLHIENDATKDMRKEITYPVFPRNAEYIEDLPF